MLSDAARALQIFAGMRNPTEKRMRRVVRTSLFFTTGVYWLIGLSAYLLFEAHTEEDVLINYGKDLNITGPGSHVASVIVEHVVKVGYALAISFTFPLIQVAVKENVFELLGWGDIMDMSNLRYYGVTVLLLAIEYVTACVVPDISVAFAVLGSTVAIFIGAAPLRHAVRLPHTPPPPPSLHSARHGGHIGVGHEDAGPLPVPDGVHNRRELPVGNHLRVEHRRWLPRTAIARKRPT